MIERHVAPVVLEALASSPAVAIVGARRCGKAALAESLEGTRVARRVFDAANRVVHTAVRLDLRTFLHATAGPVLLLNAHNAPRVLEQVAGAAGEFTTPGQLLLTSSSALPPVPTREGSTPPIARVRMYPLSQGEIAGARESFLGRMLSPEPLPVSAPAIGLDELWYRMVRGGFPEAVGLGSFEQRAAWFDWYLDRVVASTRIELASTNGYHRLPSILADVAAASSGLVAKERLRRAALVFLGGSPSRWRRIKRLVLRQARRSVPAAVRRHYLQVLERTFLVDRLPGWSPPGRQASSPAQRFVADSGLLCHLLDLPEHPGDELRMLDPMTFSFVAGELRKQASWSSTPVKLSSFRPAGGSPPVLVLEGAEDRCAGLVVRPCSVDRGCLSALEALAAAAGNTFVRGAILHCGAETIPFGKGLKAIPISAVWHW
ncbi:MAG TPA: hypothetical protein P5234_08575 [Thermoanaerobaculaceae bacterium]|nr:hypothetical protein [Thermoanaerobaculaceae bacterium]HRS16285.1 hypothetical protein [Thermoanaerobaculaceae bacterium]